MAAQPFGPDDARARKLVDLIRAEREREIYDLRTDVVCRIVTRDGVELGTLKVTFAYQIPGGGNEYLVYDTGQTLSAARVFEALNPGFFVTEVTA